MARRLKMAEVMTIHTLHQSGHSNRKIARLVGVHRETVARYVAGEDSKPAKPDPRVGSGPANACEPFRELILAKLEQGLNGVRIFQDLRDEHQFPASYSSVRPFLQGLRKVHALPVRRLEAGPGEEAQVDFGTAAPVAGEQGKRRRPWLFRIVLSRVLIGLKALAGKHDTEALKEACHTALSHGAYRF